MQPTHKDEHLHLEPPSLVHPGLEGKVTGPSIEELAVMRWGDGHCFDDGHEWGTTRKMLTSNDYSTD